MKLTLTPAKNKKKYYKVYADDEYLGQIPQMLIPDEYFLQSELTEKEIKSFYVWKKVIGEWVSKKAIELLLDYLAKMEHTVYDCMMFLKKCSIPQPIIEATVSEAIKHKWVSDERYAELYTQDSILAGRSSREIKHKLQQKRVKPEIINKVIANLIKPETQREIITELIDKLIERYADQPPQKRFEKIATALYRKGFNYTDYEDILKAKNGKG